jgi:CHAT domain-containing protein
MSMLLLAVLLSTIADIGDEVRAKIAEADALRHAGKQTEAVRAAEAAVSQARQSGDLALLLRAVGTRGNSRFYNLDYAGATSDFDEALTLSKRLGDQQHEIEHHKNLGITWSMQGRLDLALAHLHQSVEMAERLTGWASRSTHANLGTVYQRLGARRLAINEFRQALAPGPEPLTPAAELDAHTRIGSLYLEAGEPAAAIPELRSALAAAVRGSASPVEEAWVLEYLTVAEMDVGDNEAALASVRRQADLHRLVEHGPTLRLALVRLGDLQKNSAAARAAYEEAAAIGSERGRRWVWLPPSRLARLAFEKGDRATALASYRSSADALERFAGELGEDEGRAVVASNRLLYDEWMGALLPLGHSPSQDELEEAVSIIERARGEFVESIPTGRDTVLAQRKREVTERLAQTRRAANDQEMERLELELWRLQEEGNRSARRLPVRFLSALQAQLASAEAVLAYFQVHNELFLFVITAHRAELLQLPLPDRQLTLRVEALLGRLSSGAADGWQGMARRLYRDLLATALDQLPKEVRTVTIVADGSLIGMPFEVLLTPSEQALISRYSIIYSESITELLTSRRAETRSAAGRLLVLHPGPAAELRTEGDRLRALYREEGFSGTPLLHADTEVRAISAAVGAGAEVWRGRQAREAALTRQALGHFSALHFTTHGMVSRWSPWRSALLLAAGGGDDGLLQAGEIAERMPPCRLVVLAACRTAVGQLRAGREVRSLAEAFRRAGTRSVVASLWDVDDASTARLFTAFYGALADGDSPAEALRRAKLSLLRDRATASPRHWASFLLYGDGTTPVRLSSPTRRETPLRVVIVSGGVLLLAIGLGLWWQRRRAI